MKYFLIFLIVVAVLKFFSFFDKKSEKLQKGIAVAIDNEDGFRHYVKFLLEKDDYVFIETIDEENAQAILLCEKRGRKFAVYCVHSQDSVNTDAADTLKTAMEKNGYDAGILASNAYFTSYVKKAAPDMGIELISRYDLMQIAKRI